jgi:predicted transcriptional regulator
VGLVLFNVIPAFPMDGGRIFRALLAMNMNRVKATQIAARVGQFIAVIFLLLGLLFNPFLIFIALFVFLGAYGENLLVQHLAIIEGFKVRDAMLTDITKLKVNNTMAEVVEILLAGSENNFIVIERDSIAGILYHEDIIKNSKNRTTTVKDIMASKFKTLKIDQDLKMIYRLVYGGKKSFFPVVDKNKLVGAIDSENLNEFILLQSKLAY